MPLIHTKLTPPRNSAPQLLRARLLRTLAVSRLKSLTLILAPAGFGKTTLLTNFQQELVREGIPVAWVSVDEDDNDFIQFFSYVIASLQKIIPGTCLGTQALLQAGPHIPPKAIISTLINELSSIHKLVYIIFDDYHLVSEESIHKTMNYLLLHVPENIHVVIASRSVPPLKIDRLRARNQLVEIDAAAMRFTLSETNELLNELMGMQLTRQDINTLYHIIEGWAGGLQLASISLQHHKNRSDFINSFSAENLAIVNYLTADVLSHQPEPVISFLTKTSILKRMSVELCNAVAGIANSYDMIHIIEQNNLFIFPLDENRQWFRYHQLFADFLKQRLKSTMPEKAAKLHLAACKWFHDNELMEEAVYHALSANKTALAAELIEKCAMNLVEKSYMSVLLGWINKIPENHLKNRNKLKLAQAWALCLTNRTREAEAVLSGIGPENISAEKKIQFEINAVRAVCAAFRQDILRAEVMANRLMEESLDRNPWTVAVIGNVLTYVYLHLGNFSKAREVQIWAAKYQESAAGIFAAGYGMGLSGLIFSFEGRLHEAAAQYRKAISLSIEVMGLRSVLTSMVSPLLFDILYEWNEIDEAFRVLDDCHDLIDIGAPVDILITCYIPLIRSYINRRDRKAAFSILDRLEKVGMVKENDWVLAVVLHEKVRALILFRALSDAKKGFDSYTRIKRRKENIGTGLIMLETEMEKRAEARILITNGEPEKAIEILEKLYEDVSAFGFIRRKIELKALLSTVYYHTGDYRQAMTCLASALSVGKPQNMIRTFADEGMPMKKLLEMLLNNKDDVAESLPEINSKSWESYLEKLIDAFDTFSPEKLTSKISFTQKKNETNHSTGLLSSRELEILQILEKGLSNKEIAVTLSMTVNTVKWHLKNVYGKLGVSSRTEAISEARIMGILE